MPGIFLVDVILGSLGGPPTCSNPSHASDQSQHGPSIQNMVCRPPTICSRAAGGERAGPRSTRPGRPWPAPPRPSGDSSRRPGGPKRALEDGMANPCTSASCILQRMSAYMHIHTCIIYLFVHSFVFIYTRIYLYIHISAYMQMLLELIMFMCKYTYVNTHVWMHELTHLRMHVCMYVCR